MLHAILCDLDSISPDNFDSKFAETKAKMALVHELKNKLKAEYDIDELRKNEAELVLLAKQIEEKYDNMYTEMKNEKTEISSVLKNVRNRKKIAKYSR